MYHQRKRATAKSAAYNEYVCATYRKYRSNDKCSAHRISQPVIEELILTALRTVVTYAIKDETGFRKRVTDMFNATLDSEVKTKRKRLTTCEKRTIELNKLIKKLFEEHTLGNLADKRFNLLSAEYEKEQEDLEHEIAELHVGIDSHIDSTERADRFISLTKRYTDFSELTTPILNEFIDRVVVHERAEKKVKFTQQKVEIFLSFIGDFSIPDEAREAQDIDAEAEQEAHAKRVISRRQYYRDYYAKCQKNGVRILADLDKRTPEQIAADDAVKREEQRAQRREYEREYHRKKAEEKRAVKADVESDAEAATAKPKPAA